MVNQLLAFARKSDGAFTSTDINLRVREIATMLRPAMPQNITFELKLADGLPEIHADQGQVERCHRQPLHQRARLHAPRR